MPGQASRNNGRKGGRPTGTTGIQHAATITKNQARDALRAVVISHMEELVAAQIAHAKGIKYLVARSKAGGKFERVSPDQLDAMLAGQDDGSIVLEVWDKDPSVQAFTDLLNRALDKPSDHVELEHSGGIVVKWIGET